MTMVVIGVLGYLGITFAYPWADGRIWTANIRLDTPKYSKFNGKARVYDSMGTLVYEGTMERGAPSGDGTQYDDHGNMIYKGGFKGGKYEGQGELYNSSGVVLYTGSFLNNRYDGEGKLYNDIGKVIYLGTFAVGQRSGTGVEFDPVTVLKKYYGEFANDVRAGNGVEYEEDGATIRYEGMFKDGLYGGEGKLYEKSNLLYSGNFSNGVYNGEGNLYDLDIGTLVYSGEFKDGQYHGAGKLYDANTSVVIYDGEFSSGKKQGVGKTFDKLGSESFDGTFRSDSIDYIAYLGTNVAAVTDQFGPESFRTEIGNKLILTYLNLDSSIVFKIDAAANEYVCEKVIIGTKDKFMGLGAQSTAVERRAVMGEPFSSINYNCPAYYKTVFENLAININNTSSVPTDKYIMTDYFIRFYYNGGRTELKCIEICMA